MLLWDKRGFPSFFQWKWILRHRPYAQLSGTLMKVSPLLAKIFVCVSFAWDIRKLGYLEQAVSTVLSYPTSVDACVVTNAPDKLERVFETRHVSKERPRVCRESWAADVDSNKYALLWRHRLVLAAAAAGVHLLERLSARSFDVMSKNEGFPNACKSRVLGASWHAGSTRYTAYMYMEDDTQVPWRAMLAWARATPALATLNLTCGFYRSEVSPKTGELVMMDFMFRVNVSQANTVHIEGLGDFLELVEPYFGMWLASHAQLREFMAHPFWDKKTALAYPHPHNGGYPEKTNWMFQYLNVPSGFKTRSVVQYNPETRMLEPRARIIHLRNGYSVQDGIPLGKIPVTLALE